MSDLSDILRHELVLHFHLALRELRATPDEVVIRAAPIHTLHHGRLPHHDAPGACLGAQICALLEDHLEGNIVAPANSSGLVFARIRGAHGATLLIPGSVRLAMFGHTACALCNESLATSADWPQALPVELAGALATWQVVDARVDRLTIAHICMVLGSRSAVQLSTRDQPALNRGRRVWRGYALQAQAISERATSFCIHELKLPGVAVFAQDILGINPLHRRLLAPTTPTTYALDRHSVLFAASGQAAFGAVAAWLLGDHVLEWLPGGVPAQP
mmetsp:Transcript_6561/g.13563  ORF Transcript_6561/g.13563 Transcript_6561/m.13563 type:complete len:274 (-) Transcript_6561:1182-2003(-)